MTKTEISAILSRICTLWIDFSLTFHSANSDICAEDPKRDEIWNEIVTLQNRLIDLGTHWEAKSERKDEQNIICYLFANF